MSDVLKKIIADKKIHVAAQKKKTPEKTLLKNIGFVPEPRGFENALKKKAEKKQVGLIAEVKKASPSRGVIRKDFNPVDIAIAYEKGGATCVSVLTDEPYFMGKDEYLTEVKKNISLPVLRKDFIVDTYQVAESRILGADCILLIMAAVDDKLARDIYEQAKALDMDVLVEVHDEKEMERALKIGARLVGINNRNLKTLEVDINVTLKLKDMVKKDCILVSESGIENKNDIKKISSKGVYNFLVGESLMRQRDILNAIKELLS